MGARVQRCHSVERKTCVMARALPPGSFPAPRLRAWVRFLEPRCHLPPNSNNVVDQQLFTNRQEDGTNLITPYSPVSPSRETVSISAPCVFLDSRPPQVDSDSNYEYRVPLKWP